MAALQIDQGRVGKLAAVGYEAEIGQPAAEDRSLRRDARAFPVEATRLLLLPMKWVWSGVHRLDAPRAGSSAPMKAMRSIPAGKVSPTWSWPPPGRATSMGDLPRLHDLGRGYCTVDGTRDFVTNFPSPML